MEGKVLVKRSNISSEIHLTSLFTEMLGRYTTPALTIIKHKVKCWMKHWMKCRLARAELEGRTPAALLEWWNSDDDFVVVVYFIFE